MQKSAKLTAVYALIMDLPLSLVITLVALALSNIDAPGSLNGPNYIRMAIIAYVVTFFVNFIHAERWGFAFAVKHAKPGTFKFGLLLNLVVAGVFVVILDLIMTAIGMIAGGAFSFGPYIAAVLKGFIMSRLRRWDLDLIRNKRIRAAGNSQKQPKAAGYQCYNYISQHQSKPLISIVTSYYYKDIAGGKQYEDSGYFFRNQERKQ